MLDNVRSLLWTPLLASLVLVGCADEQSIDAHHAAAATCDVQVERILGVDGSHPVSPETDVLVELSQPSRGWDAWIEDVPSVSVREPSGDRLVVRPDHTLEPGSDYVLWVRDCHGAEHAHTLPVGAR